MPPAPNVPIEQIGNIPFTIEPLFLKNETPRKIIKCGNVQCNSIISM